MIKLDFYKSYVSDLSSIEVLISKENEEVMSGQEFIDNIDIEEYIDIHNLKPLDKSADNFLIDCIGLQWEVYISNSNRDLIKYKD